MNLEQRAKQFATNAHAGQVRKYTGDPYIIHPEAVADLVRSVVDHTEEMLAAAWLHDVVEDTATTIEEVELEFGHEVAILVGHLSDISKPTDGNRSVRKSIDLAHTAKATPDAKTIKLADLINNSGSIVAHDPKFAKVYLREKALLLEVLIEGDRSLFVDAQRIVKEAQIIT